jgi:hypothetical protein
MLRRIPRNRDGLTDYRELGSGGQRPHGAGRVRAGWPGRNSVDTKKEDLGEQGK